MTALVAVFGAVFGFYLLLVVTWVLYVAVMHMKVKRETMGRVALFHSYVALFIFGYPLDLIANAIVSLLAFQRLPKDWLLTGTLKYWVASDDKRRAKWASYICRDLLNPFDPSGKHC